MHIGFDISQTGAGKAGCGYYAHAMAQSLLRLAPQHRFSLYPSFGDFYFDAAMPAENPYPGANVRYGPRHRTLGEARAFWNRPGLDEALGTPDVVQANNFWCPTGLASARLVFTLHDLGFVTEPSWTTRENYDACLAGVTRAAREADWIAAISEASRRHYLQLFPQFPEERIAVVHPCSRFIDAAAQGTRPAAVANVPEAGFWLSVGTIEPRKNQRGIAEAYARYLQLGGAPMPLVFAGGRGWLMDHFEAHLRELGLREHVILAGYVSDDELVWLYRHCHAHVYFSWFEGFGLPVLEGMQFGAPTLASDTTSIPEVAGDAAILLKPDDVQGLAAAMLRLAATPAERERLSSAARRQAARFRWEASAQALLALYERAIAAPKRSRGLRKYLRAWQRLVGSG
jgi:glycosyltransferase involved in cell wall biosynthesis